MNRNTYKVDDGSGFWVEVKAESPSDAAEQYTRDHAEEEGWCTSAVDVRVLDDEGWVHHFRVNWRLVMEVDVREVSCVSHQPEPEEEVGE